MIQDLGIRYWHWARRKAFRKQVINREATLRVLRLERRALSFTDVGRQPQFVSGFRV